ncbi:hypothetical protein C8Q77DRAFT_1154908 [Trametes polyzona]|nr:hypothetical protein C8Q77DRAFT_1154908 [Trametes polyzona]
MLFLQDGPPVATAAIPGRPPKDHPGYPQILYHELEGKLFTYVRVPRDAVLQMAECVPTADLVEMSRTDAAFCQLLMEPDVAHLWKDAWRNVEGAPECPPYMEDMVYAVLLYSDRCRRCGEARESSVVFEWQIRYCVQCKSEKTRNVTEEKEYIREIMDETGVEDLLCVVDDHLHIPELDAFRECWNGLSEDKEARKELAEESAKNVALRKEAAKKYREWRTDGQGTRPRSDNVGIGWERFKLIRKGIDAEDVVLFRDEFAWRHCVDEATERTDCNTRIKAGSSQPGLSGGTPMDCAYILPATFEFLYLKWTEDFLLPRVEVFHLQIVQTWAEVWDPDECSPDDPQAFKRLRPADFLAFLEVKWNLTAQPGDTLFMEVREMTSEKLSGMVERWYDDRRTDLNELFKEAMPDFAAENDVVPVELAVCMFDCVDPRCGARFMHYPAVLDHRCRRISIAPAKTAAYDIVVQEYMSRQREPPAWNKTSVRISLVICGGRAEAIVRACGLDPKNATPEDLHKTGARMTCADCRDKGIESEFGIEVFDWQRAVRAVFVLYDGLRLIRTASAAVVSSDWRTPRTRHQSMPVGDVA